MEQSLENGYNYINILKRIYPNQSIRDICTESYNQLNQMKIEIKLSNKAFGKKGCLLNMFY